MMDAVERVVFPPNLSPHPTVSCIFFAASFYQMCFCRLVVLVRRVPVSWFVSCARIKKPQAIYRLHVNVCQMCSHLLLFCCFYSIVFNVFCFNALNAVCTSGRGPCVQRVSTSLRPLPPTYEHGALTTVALMPAFLQLVSLMYIQYLFNYRLLTILFCWENSSRRPSSWHKRSARVCPRPVVGRAVLQAMSNLSRLHRWTFGVPMKVMPNPVPSPSSLPTALSPRRCAVDELFVPPLPSPVRGTGGLL